MERVVFVHTNPKQILGAIVAAYALRRASAAPERFRVEILRSEDFAIIEASHGRTYRCGGEQRTWRNDDLQSFTPLRFVPPERMGYSGRAVIMDPDVFALGDINELLDRDMQGKALLCRWRPDKRYRPGYLASSVMLLDCAKLTHWRMERDFAALFDGERDYKSWMELEYEPPGTVGLFEPEWNDFDHLTSSTKLLHTTRRRTQPWKTGLPTDFSVTAPLFGFIPRSWQRSARRMMGGVDRYQAHTDPRQEHLFFGLLRECVDAGLVTTDLLRSEMAKDHLRHDALAVLERTPPLPVLRLDQSAA